MLRKDHCKQAEIAQIQLEDLWFVTLFYLPSPLQAALNPYTVPKPLDVSFLQGALTRSLSIHF